jgi:hypothetical protein
LEGAAQFGGSFLHGLEADAGMPGTGGRAVVDYLDLQVVLAVQRQYGRGRGRVPYDIRQRLGRDPVRRNLQRSRQRRQPVRGNLHANRRPIRSERQLIYSLSQRADQPELVQRRWTQVLHQLSYVGNRRTSVCAQSIEQLDGSRGAG